ncbi:MAG: hypothetical protein ABJC33_04185 [Betaproteobacteria bacterium]
MITPADTFAAEPSAAFVAAAADRVAHWLLHGPAQLEEGPHAGAVAGSLDPEMQPHYVYPEITGYYLQWLAWRARRTGNARLLAPRAQAAHDWLRRWSADALPETRVHLRGTADDWRNRTTFTFDIAMALRGIGSATAQGLLRPSPDVVGHLGVQLRRLVDADGVFKVCLDDTGASLPQRWSTRRGGFLAKAAAGILRAAEQIGGIPGEITQAAAKTWVASLGWATDTPHEDVHPLLYTYEGMLSRPGHDGVIEILPTLIDRFDALLREVSRETWIPETLGQANGPERVDIMAQALRVNELLPRRSEPPLPSRNAMAALRSRLAQSVRGDGAVPFALGAQPVQLNVWAAMFASQALEGMRGGTAAVKRTAEDPLLV